MTTGPATGAKTSGDEEALATVQRLIRNRCVTDPVARTGSEVRNAETLAAVLDVPGIEVTTHEAAAGRVNLVARLAGRDPTAPGLLLLGHSDVPAADEGAWDHDPFAAELHDGLLVGRGAMTMLSHLATMALALRDLASSGFTPSGHLTFVAAADGEADDRLGVAWLLEHHPEALDARWVLTENGGVPIPGADGIRLALIVAEKSIATYRLTIEGEPGHSALPFRVQTATQVAAAAITRMEAYRPRPRINDLYRRSVEGLGFGSAAASLLDAESLDRILDVMDMPEVARAMHAATSPSLAVMGVRSATTTAALPGGAIIDVLVRLLPGDDREDSLAVVHDALGDLADRVHVECLSWSPGSESPVDGELADALARASHQRYPGAHLWPTMTTGTTTGRLLRQRGQVTYGFGLHTDAIGAFTTSSHLHAADDEAIDPQSLVLMRGLWAQVARDLLGE